MVNLKEYSECKQGEREKARRLRQIERGIIDLKQMYQNVP